MTESTDKRDYSMFEADLSGQVLNMHLLGRLLSWLKPYRYSLLISSALVLIASTFQVVLPIIISLVAIDHIFRGESDADTPDFGLIEFNTWLIWLRSPIHGQRSSIVTSTLYLFI